MKLERSSDLTNYSLLDLGTIYSLFDLGQVPIWVGLDFFIYKNNQKINEDK